MSAQIKYANGVLVNYSLTTYSPYEGYRIAFNGKKGRMESWEDIPWREEERVNQAELHAKEMDQNLEEARDMLRIAMEARPEDPHIIDSYAWAEYKLGNFKEAAKTFNGIKNL